MSDVEIDVLDNEPVEIELETDERILNEIETMPLYGPRGPKGEDGADGFSPSVTVTQTETGATITATDKDGTTTANILNGTDGINGQDGQDGADGQAATVTVGTTTTGAAGTNASVVNSGTSSAAVLDFTIPKGDKGDTGATGADGQDGFSPTATVTQSNSVTTISITDINGTTTERIDLSDKQDSLLAGTDLEIIPPVPQLPSGFTALEWIESDGDCCIDLGYMSKGDDEVEQKIKLIGAYPNATASWFGSLQGEIGSVVPRFSIGTTQSQTNSQFFAGFNSTPTLNTRNNETHIIKMFCKDGRYYASFDDKIIEYTPSNSANPSINSYLFARNGATVVTDRTGIRFYYHRQTRQDGTPVANLVPAKRNSDDVLGIFNAANNTFLTNIGTGTLTAGPVTTYNPNAIINFTNKSGYLKDVQINGTSAVTGSVANITGLTPYTSFIVPDTTDMPVIATYEYDITTTDYLRFLSIANNYTSLSQIKGFAIFRMTITGTDIKQTIEAIIQQRQSTESPYLFIRNYRGNDAVANSGIRYLRICYPRNLNNGYNWDIELSAYNSTARHIKLEVIRTEPQFTWLSTLAPSTYDTTYQASFSLTASTSEGVCGSGTLYFNANTASSASYVTSYLSKLIGGTQPLTGAALLASQFVFMNGNKVYPASNTTTPIETGYGLAICTTAYNSGEVVAYTAISDKRRITSLTNIPHATFTRGNPCYFRCTMDSSGNIYSDNYVATSMTAGYTWYYVGVSGVSEINVNTTNGVFLTLDANGKLTHVNGKEIASSGGGGTVDQTYDPTSANAQSGVAIAGAGFGTVKTVNNTQPDANGDVTIQGGHTWGTTSPTTTTSTISSTNPSVVVENYVNGASWYRVYSDKWCEQGGVVTVSQDSPNKKVSLLKEYANTYYMISTNYEKQANYSSSASYVGQNLAVQICAMLSTSHTTEEFYIASVSNVGRVHWMTQGYIS